MLRRAFAVWMTLVVGAVANGAFRGAVLVPAYGEKTAHQISVLTLCAIILFISRTAIAWISASTARGALAIGGVWLISTVAFEFLVGHYLFGASWSRLLAEYDLLHGRIWILVLLCTLVAPLWAFRTSTTARSGRYSWRMRQV